MNDNDLIQSVKDYYDSKEADKFYQHILGRENIHVGIYESPEQTMEEASQHTVLTMIKKMPVIKKSHKILDIGSGYGGAARFIAQTYGCRVDCLNLSETQNKYNLAKVKKAELEKTVTVTTGNFEQIPFSRETYDFVWSQDAIMYSNIKDKVFREVARVLKPEGRFIFTDILQSDDCPDGALADVFAHSKIEGLGSVKLYKRLAGKADLERVFAKRMPGELVTHFSKILEAIDAQYSKLAKQSGEAFVKKRMATIQALIDAGKKGYLGWGILQFQKRNT
ncbi:MAG TPA: class I SAM-dependent methyltransferase [Bacteroidetes bacterium]|nr:class I SAM-dependent methyltransferase [Bacteroidota bacterium]